MIFCWIEHVFHLVLLFLFYFIFFYWWVLLPSFSPLSFNPNRISCERVDAAAELFTPAEIEPHSSTAFLQIRPGKADYGWRPPSLSFSYSRVGGEWVRVDIFRFVRCRYLTLPFQHLGGEGGWRSYMTLLPSVPLSIALLFILSVFFCRLFAINMDSSCFTFVACRWIVSIVLKRMTDRVCVKRPERCVSISFSSEVEAVGLSQLLHCSYNWTLRQGTLLSKLHYSCI